MRTALYTLVAMLAFAGNSIICRLALRDDLIDPGSFTSVRLASGAFALLLIGKLRCGDDEQSVGGSWTSAFMLFTYALCFSYAYVSLDTATGALILFAFVQATMIIAGILEGDRPAAGEWAGWLLASGGLVWLLLPGAARPSTQGAVLMALAGIAWGIYSCRGRSEISALAATSANFLKSLALVAPLALATVATAETDSRGFLLAVLSGAVTSGMGYVVWYSALEHLRSIQAAVVQLAVPILAAAGGALLLAEAATLQLLVATILLLGGIAIAIMSKRKSTRNSESWR